MSKLHKEIYYSAYTRARLESDEHLPLVIRRALKEGVVAHHEIPPLVDLYREVAWRSRWAAAVLKCREGKQIYIPKPTELDSAVEMLPSVWAFGEGEWEHIEPEQGETRNEYLARVNEMKCRTLEAHVEAGMFAAARTGAMVRIIRVGTDTVWYQSVVDGEPEKNADIGAFRQRFTPFVPGKWA